MAAAALITACGGDKAAVGTLPGTGGDFFVLSSDPLPDSQVYLNDSVFVTFTNDVDLTTANLNTISFAVFDLNGVPLQEQPRGTFFVRSAFGGSAGNTRVLEFRPAFPDNDEYSNGGFKPGRKYLLQIAQGDARQSASIKDRNGRGLREPFTLAFQTVVGNTSSQLFRDQQVGGPNFVSAAVAPSTEGVVNLGKKGQVPVEVRVNFDQPLNPASTNVPTKLDPNPLKVDPREIDVATKGRVFLEYDDPEYGPNAWIPATVVVDANSNQGSTLLLTPTGNLPNNSTIRIIVEATLEDLSGESNRNNAEHTRVVGTFRTEVARTPQFDAVVENFDSLDNVDLDAPFFEPRADVGPGYARASFEFEGGETQFDYRPTVREVVLNTDFTQISPTNGAPFNVSGGVFQFRNVTIPAGVTVRGTGSKPMVWLVTGDFIVEGELSVAGGDGARVDTLNSANFPTPGGVGVCGGGNGGRGSPSATSVDRAGESGYGSFQTPGGGGRGGAHSCTASGSSRGGGGGGGSYSTQGDPYFVLGFTSSTSMPRTALGRGGPMGNPPSGTQADAGPLAFLDTRRDNDFWGSQVDPKRQLRITGELLAPRGGAGGGGGGDTGPACVNANFINDQKGGGGGAGGGILVIKALGRVIVKAAGLINANGGYGGGGEQAGTNSNAGGGGAGSGGMIVLMSGTGIHLVAHGRPYSEGTTSNTNRAFDFIVQADGGTGLRGPFQGNPVSGKYPGKGGPTAASIWDSNPIGGFGGLGLVQLMAPPGDNLPIAQGGDGTRTKLDDRIYFYENDARLADGLVPGVNPHAGAAMTGPTKGLFLGWRGFRDEAGVGRDDAGDEIRLAHANQGGEGDIRPSPLLLPTPFAPLTRARSRWIDTGATARLADATGSTNAPRTFVEQLDSGDPTNPFTNLKAGPTYLFSGTIHQTGQPQGYVRYRQTDLGVERDVPSVLPNAVAVAEVVASATWESTPAYIVRLAQSSSVLGQIPGRYTGYRADLRNSLGSSIGSYRVLSHTDRDIYLSTETGALPEDPVASVQLLADFIGFRNTEGDGFGSTTVENGRNVPLVNVRVGFAFHVNPRSPEFTAPGQDARRYPNDISKFLHTLDLQRPEVIQAIRSLGKENGATKGAVAVQWDLLFNSAFSEIGAGNVDAGRQLSPNAPRAEIRYLVLPFQF